MHYTDVIMSTMASQITSLTIVYSAVYSGADERIHQSSASLAFVRGILWWPVNSPHKGPVTQKKFPFDDVIMDCWCSANNIQRLTIPCKDPLRHPLKWLSTTRVVTIMGENAKEILSTLGVANFHCNHEIWFPILPRSPTSYLTVMNQFDNPVWYVTKCNSV